MIDLSVIIVNYNVEYFLEQCLHSVLKATKGLECEIFVVDNNSVDGSIAMVEEKFSEVILIANKENLGFSKANNMAIRKSRGRYVLLLNPDTLVEEDTLVKSVAFMDERPDAGGLGVRMIDGRGRFLPESKRGLPTPAVAFYKIFGLAALFPKSRIFGKYHLGYLSQNENHEVEILSGAYMMMRRTCLDEIGLLDEAFFMYGEDIDLSYRIIKGGYKNYYLADTRIIHYKGESTKKSSINYVFVFYRAMVIFAEKHFSARRAGIFSFFINMAIYLRAGMAIGVRFLKRAALPVFDAAVLIAALFILRDVYESFAGKTYDAERTSIAFFAYVAVWMTSVYISGGYERPVKYAALFRGLGAGTIITLIAYALLPESLRFSRALVLMGAAAAFAIYGISRYILHLAGVSGFKQDDNRNKTTGIVAGHAEFERISALLSDAPNRASRIFRISPKGSTDKEAPHAERIQEVVNVYKPDTLIFSGQDITSADIIAAMAEIRGSRTDFKIAPPESLYIIGSNSVEKGGELFIMDINAINKDQNRRKKRLFDLMTGGILAVGFPVLMLFVKQKRGLFKNIFAVIAGRKTWVGYARESGAAQGLPVLREGVLSPLDKMGKLKAPADTARKLNAVYARDYTLRGDLSVMLAGFSQLGRRDRPIAGKDI
ncbi:MAG: glycosyltransferase family 2 protein [Cryomorphaceae bacterium]